MEGFVIIVNGWKLLIIITKLSILDVATALDPPMNMGIWVVDALNLLFIIGSYTEIKLLKK